MIKSLFFIAILISALFCVIQISKADFKRRIIPDVYLFPLFLFGFLITTFFPWFIDIQESILAAFFGYFLSLSIGFLFSKLSKNNSFDTPIGMGDIKLLGTGGAWLGFTGLALSLIFSCIFATIWAKLNKQRFVPFAPFFFAGAFLAFIIMGFLL